MSFSRRINGFLEKYCLSHQNIKANSEIASLYIHVPFCKKKCNYCDFFSVSSQEALKLLEPQGNKASLYAETTANDVLFMQELFSIKAFSTIYLGGGTPSLLSQADLELFGEKIFSHSTKGAEITIELNPESVTESFIEKAFQVGINRFSLGIQTLSDNTLKSQGRLATKADCLKALKLLKNAEQKHGIAISCDIMLGFENQSESEVDATVQELLRFEVPHISAYTLCTDDHLQDMQNDKAFSLFALTQELLCEKGYNRYEVSNFSLSPETEAKHNKAYWKMQNYLGVGPGAVGTVRLLNQNHKLFSLRTIAKPNLHSFTALQDSYEVEKLSFCDTLKEVILMGFRLKEGIEKPSFYHNFNLSLPKILTKTLKKWKSCILETESHISLTDKGLDFLSSFLVDAFLELEEGMV